MKLLAKIFSICIVAMLCTSCGESLQYGANQYSWGKKELYRDFLWSSYDANDSTHCFIKRMAFDFNEDAMVAGAVGDIVFCLVEKEFDEEGLPTGKYVPTEKFVMHKNGERCEGNRLTINPSKESDGEIEISLRYNTEKIELLEKDDLTHVLRLQVVSNGGLDRIGDLDVSELPVMLDDEWVLEQHYVWNPLRTFVTWAAIILGALLLVICIVCRMMSPKIKTAIMMIEPTSKSIVKKVDGARKVILTSSSKMKEGTKWNLFKGKTKVVKDPIFVDDIVLTCGNKGARVTTTRYTIDPPTKVIKMDAVSEGEYKFVSKSDETKSFKLRVQ